MGLERGKGTVPSVAGFGRSLRGGYLRTFLEGVNWDGEQSTEASWYKGVVSTMSNKKWDNLGGLAEI